MDSFLPLCCHSLKSTVEQSFSILDTRADFFFGKFYTILYKGLEDFGFLGVIWGFGMMMVLF